MSETKEPWEVEQIDKKKTTEIKKVENTPLEKRNKEEQIQTALRLKSDARLAKAKRSCAEDTTLRLNGWAEKNMIFDKTRWWVEKMKITMPLEQNKNGMEWTKGNKVLAEHAYNKG